MKEIKFKIIEEITEDQIVQIQEICWAIFDYFDMKEFKMKFENYKPTLLIIAVSNTNNLLGFKFGYTLNANVFFSWLGGVRQEHRNNGIASELMRLQFQWCLEKQYKFIETHSSFKWKNMIALNLKVGFRQVGTYLDKRGKPKIIFQKTCSY